MNPPLVSICMPTYNGETFIRQALESALKQTYRPLEIIISDDASVDNTIAIIEALSEETDIPILIFNHKPCGIGANWNHCIENSNGEYIKFLFQDDLLKPDCIKSMMQLIESDHEIGLVFCKRELLVDKSNDDTKEWSSQFNNLQSGWTRIEQVQYGRDLLKDVNFLSHPRNKVGEPSAVLLRKSVFSKVGYFNTELKQALDYEFWYRVFKYFKVGFIESELATFRIHENQATAKNSKANISDYQEYPKLVYKNLFWYLHPILKKELFFQYNCFGKLVKKVKNKITRQITQMCTRRH